ncbi:(+)-neomenthol dehydrogenase [Quillaja saponaria]|uniref:(+)-neomenthol dehydrogenase n=1 Tax=Quillaja saponaria TaxID=32244 RepID=A0AAD7PYR0_QUISA|nr:(+)-neomenthol dehydrogenase [Quillaja saponaria]
METMVAFVRVDGNKGRHIVDLGIEYYKILLYLCLTKTNSESSASAIGLFITLSVPNLQTQILFLKLKRSPRFVSSSSLIFFGFLQTRTPLPSLSLFPLLRASLIGFQTSFTAVQTPPSFKPTCITDASSLIINEQKRRKREMGSKEQGKERREERLQEISFLRTILYSDYQR